MKEKEYKAKIEGDEIIVWEKPEEVYDIGCYGKMIEDHLILSPCEALHLIERKKLVLKDGRKKVKKSRNILTESWKNLPVQNRILKRKSAV